MCVDLHIASEADATRDADGPHQVAVKHSCDEAEVIGCGIDIDISLEMVHIHEVPSKSIGYNAERRGKLEVDVVEAQLLHVSAYGAVNGQRIVGPTACQRRRKTAANEGHKVLLA